MPRFARLNAPDAVHHLISRFVNRAFRLTTPEERAHYLHRIPAVLQSTDWSPLGFALMSNHIHWVALAGREPSCRFMQPLHAGFAAWLNRHQGTLGPVFALRHTSVLCARELTARLLAYVHNNPVRAGLCSDPSDSDWTSHRAYLGLCAAPPWLDVHRGLALCGFDATPRGRLAFHEHVCALAAQPPDKGLSGGDLSRDRARLRLLLGTPVELSAQSLPGPSEERQQVVLGAPGMPYRPRWPGSPREALDLVAQRTQIPVELMQSRTRRREVTTARRLALLTWTRHLGRAQQEMSGALGLATSSASGLLRKRGAAVAELQRDATTVAEQCWRLTSSSVQVAGA